MFIIDCQPELLPTEEIVYKDCHFNYVGFHTNPPLSLIVSENVVIEILNTIDEETQYEFIAHFYSLPTTSEAGKGVKKRGKNENKPTN